jgi:hypothetical protein
MIKTIKKNVIILVFMCLVLNLGIVFSENNSVINSNIPLKLNSNDLCLGKISLGMPYKDVIKIMGKPEKESGNINTVLFLDFKDKTDIAISCNVVQVINVYSDKYPTPRGLKVGDTKEKVLKLYDKPKEGEYKDKIWSYFIEDTPNFDVFFKDKEDTVECLSVYVQEI